MPLSEAAARASLAQQTGEVFLAYMLITHPDIEPIRVVCNNESITRADGEYGPWPFSVEWPESAEDVNVSMNVTLDNIDQGVTKIIRELTGDPPKAQIGVVLASSPDVVEFGPYALSVLSAEYDELTIGLTLGRDEDPLNLQVPRQRYLPSNSPGLF